MTGSVRFDESCRCGGCHPREWPAILANALTIDSSDTQDKSYLSYLTNRGCP